MGGRAGGGLVSSGASGRPKSLRSEAGPVEPSGLGLRAGWTSAVGFCLPAVRMGTLGRSGPTLSSSSLLVRASPVWVLCWCSMSSCLIEDGPPSRRPRCRGGTRAWNGAAGGGLGRPSSPTRPVSLWCRAGPVVAEPFTSGWRARLTAVSFGLTLRVLRGRRGTGVGRRARIDGREAELWELLVVSG